MLPVILAMRLQGSFAYVVSAITKFGKSKSPVKSPSVSPSRSPSKRRFSFRRKSSKKVAVLSSPKPVFYMSACSCFFFASPHICSGGWYGSGSVLSDVGHR